MLNTDLHKSQLGLTGHNAGKKRVKKMSRPEFLNNLRNIDNTEALSRDYLSVIYDSIEAHPISMHRTIECESRHGPGGSGEIRSSIYISGVAPVRGADSDDLTSMIKSLIRSVKPAQELLRGLAIHEHPFLDVSNYDFSQTRRGNAFVPRDFVWTALRYTWHHFLAIVNSTLETAHLDPTGLGLCLDVLEYAICATICLDMTMERSAFVAQLSRVKFFSRNRSVEEKGDGNGQIPTPHDFHHQEVAHEGHQHDEWVHELHIACSDPKDDKAKIGAVDQMAEMIGDIRSSLCIDSRLQREMTGITRRIRNGEILLNDPTRSFLREGDMVKRSSRSGRSVHYHFFLFTDKLIYGHLSSSGDYKVHEELPLHLMKITDSALDGSIRNSKMKVCFHIQHPRKSFFALAPSEDSKKTWMKDINMAIKKDVERKARLEGARLASAAKST